MNETLSRRRKKAAGTDGEKEDKPGK